MSLKRISPTEARVLVTEEGYAFLDVRSIPEFGAGHPTGAYNVPLMHQTRFGMQPNRHFMAEVQATFPKDTKLVLGCKAGGRSMRAAMALVEAGYTQIVDQRAGFSGANGEAGWSAAGLPVSSSAEPGRSHAEISKQAGTG